MTDQELMQSIKTKWGAAIAAACHSSSVPEGFLAALVANESGGDPNAKRFEKKVLASLWEVLSGRKAAFGTITRDKIVQFVCPINTVVSTSATPYDMQVDAFTRLDDLAASWGLTQIMGYHILEGGVWTGADGLATPEVNLRTAIHMLTDFGHRFSLDLADDFADLLRCWNTGSPNGVTFDPAYVPNGLRRKSFYEALL